MLKPTRFNNVRLKANYLPEDEYSLEVRTYAMGQGLALIVYSPDGEVMCKASVNPPVAIYPPLVAIKNWGENAGIEPALIAAGIIEPEVLDVIGCGYEEANIYALSDWVIERLQTEGGLEL